MRLFESITPKLVQWEDAQNPQQKPPQPGEIFVKGGESIGLIPLFTKRGFSGLFATVDMLDVPSLAPFKWLTLVRSTIYAGRIERRENGKRAPILMHHAIIGMPPDGLVCDHWDLDSLNNRRLNLRWVNRAQNSANRRTYSKHGFKGIYPKAGKWYAQITINTIHYNLGHYDTKEQAASAYDLKAKETWGEFARLNFPISE